MRASGPKFIAFLFGASLSVMLCPLPSVARPYVKAVYSLPLSLDPIKMNDTASLVAGNLIYDGLLRFSPFLKLEGALADSWSTSSDGKVLTFVLRRSARFHNGASVDAADVVFSLRRALSSQSEVRKYYDCIEGKAGEGISAKDARTVEIRLKHPFPPFLSVLAGATAKILPRKLAQEPGFFDHPVGAGAFKFVKKTLSPNKAIFLAAFSEYHRGTPKVAELALREMDEAAATWIIGLNARLSPFKAAKVRRLFRLDMNAEEFRQKFYPDAAPAKGYIPPGLPGFGFGSSSAIGIAGRPPKEKIKVVIPKELAKAEEMRKALEESLRGKGWNIQVETMAWVDLMAGYEGKSHQAFLVSMNMDYPDPEFLLRNFESTNPDNFSGVRNAKLDQMLKEARAAQNRRKREALYKRAIEIISDEAVTINLFHPRANYWTSDCVEGFVPNILSDVYIDYSKVSLKAGCPGKLVKQ